MSIDRDLVCRGCGTRFVFTAGEQAFYLRKGFDNDPSRCPECRAGNSRDRSVTSSSSHAGTGHESRELQLFAACCSACGKDTQVTAQVALGDEPIYCPECLAARRGSGPTLAGGWREDW